MDMLILEDKKVLQFSAAMLTDRGRRRSVNEDAVFQFTDYTDTGQNVGLYIVCDGLGGHRAGDVASQLAIETVTTELSYAFSLLKSSSRETYLPSGDNTLGRFIQAAITEAHISLRDYAAHYPNHASGLATTMTLALIYDGTAYIANVGDSRAYIWRAGVVSQITQDHSFPAELARMGEIDEDQIASHPQSNVLTRALGSGRNVKADLYQWDLQAGDTILLCSDGLWKAFPDRSDLARWFGRAVTPGNLCRRLVTEANKRDGSDNISAVAISIDEIAGRDALTGPTGSTKGADPFAI